MKAILETIVGILVLLGIPGSCTAMLVLDIRNEHNMAKACYEKHKGVDYTEEQFVAKTSTGCSVYYVSVNNGTNCRVQQSLYVTDCDSVCWDRSNGKFRHRVCNGKEQR